MTDLLPSDRRLLQGEGIDESENPSNGWRSPALPIHQHAGGIAHPEWCVTCRSIIASQEAPSSMKGTYNTLPVRGMIRVPLERIADPIGPCREHEDCDGEPCSHPDLSAEASDLGIRPGTWPQTIIVEDQGANATYLYADHDLDRDGDLTEVRYRRSQGGIFTVWND